MLIFPSFQFIVHIKVLSLLIIIFLILINFFLPVKYHFLLQLTKNSKKIMNFLRLSIYIILNI